MNRILIILCLTAICLLGCENKNPQPEADYPLKAFNISVNQRKYHAEIDQETKVARIGAIRFTGEINDVGYKLADGMTISPDPAGLLGNWPEEQKFTISGESGESHEYTVVLSAYEGRWPEKPGEVVFFDDFDQVELDETVWDRVQPGTAAWQVEMSGSPKHSYLDGNGNLVLKIEKVDGKTQAGAVKTEYNKWFSDCRIEIRAKWNDGGESVGRALWLMPQSPYMTYKGWPDGGEVDIMEHTYWTTYVRQTLHSHYIHNIGDSTEPGNPAAGRVTYVGASGGYKAKDWNVYGVDLTGESVQWHINGQQTAPAYTNKHLENEAEVKQWPFAAPFYIILSIGTAGSGDALAADLPATMLIDYVRVTRL